VGGLVLSVDELINSVQQSLVCPVCKRHFVRADIKVRGKLDNANIVQVTCANNHPPLTTLIVASQRANEVPHFIAIEKRETGKKLTTNDVIDSHIAIEKFDGDFQKLWQK
jgi:hypothetical protein